MRAGEDAHGSAEQPRLTARGFRKSYGGVHAVVDVDLDLHAGEIVGLIGPNGAGKTTLVDLITGFQTADQGKVWLDGSRLSGAGWARARSGLARTFQQTQLSFDLSLYENVAMGLVPARLTTLRGILRETWRGLLRGNPLDVPDGDRIERTAAMVGLRDLDRMTDSVSFGEMRLVEIARAIVTRPRAVMLDEPFPGLAEEELAYVVEAIRGLRQIGCAVLVIDHNVDLVCDISDRAVLMSAGEIVLDGSPEAVRSDDRTRAVYLG